jgi:hypothetical protein
MDITTLLSDFTPVTLQKMNTIPLMKRHDTKYVLRSHMLPALLQKMSAHYSVLTIDEKKIHPYLTLYFDTPDLHCYLEHHNRRRHRFKFRTRKYLVSNLTYNEIKEKKNTGKTYKTRIKRSSLTPMVDKKFESFIHEETRIRKGLIPVLNVYYTRITLAHRFQPERITIDRDICFCGHKGEYTLPKTVIVERKTERSTHNSRGRTILRELSCRPTGFSKYCIGTAITTPGIKMNNFKQKVRYLSPRKGWTHERVSDPFYPITF